MDYCTKVDHIKFMALLTALHNKTDYRWVEGEAPLDYTPPGEPEYLFFDTKRRVIQTGCHIFRSLCYPTAEEVPFARMLDIAVRCLEPRRDVLSKVFGNDRAETKIIWRQLDDKTTAVLVETVDGSGVGVSRCNPRDDFSETIGFTVAYERACQKMSGERISAEELKACLYAGIDSEKIIKMFGWE